MCEDSCETLEKKVYALKIGAVSCYGYSKADEKGDFCTGLDKKG